MEDARSAALAALADTVAVWRLVRESFSDVEDAATECLVHGIDSPALREVAGGQGDVEDAVAELGLALEPDHERAAMDVMLRRFAAGRLTAYRLVSWARCYLGPEGDFRRFVDLAYRYEERQYTGIADDELERQVARLAEAHLSSAD